jgi:hypothetical protein
MTKEENEYIPNKSIWLVFDLSNGHKPTRRYVWWFDTKKDAEAHIKFQKTYKDSAPLSKPFKFKPA